MIPGPGNGGEMDRVPEANLQERIRAEARRLPTEERLIALTAFNEELYPALSSTLAEALAEGNVGLVIPLLLDAMPFLRLSEKSASGVKWFESVLGRPETKEVPRILQVRGHLALGQLRCAMGDFAGALAPLRQAQRESKLVSDKYIYLATTNHLAMVYDRLHLYRDAQANFLYGIQLAEEMEHEGALCMLHVSLSASYLMSGDYASALAIAQKAVGFSGGAKENLARGALNLATIMIALNKPEAPLAVARAIAAARVTDDPILNLLAQLHAPLLNPDLEAARVEAEQISRTLYQHGIPIPVRIAEQFQQRGIPVS